MPKSKPPGWMKPKKSGKPKDGPSSVTKALYSARKSSTKSRGRRGK